jgi:hypothetical protein
MRKSIVLAAAFLAISSASDAGATAKRSGDANLAVVWATDAVLQKVSRSGWEKGYESHEPGTVSRKVLYTTFGANFIGITFFTFAGHPDVLRISGIIDGENFKFEFVNGVCEDTHDSDSIPCSTAPYQTWKKIFYAANRLQD